MSETRADSDADAEAIDHDSRFNHINELTQQNFDDTGVSTPSESSDTSTYTLTDKDSPVNETIFSDDDSESDDSENSGSKEETDPEPTRCKKEIVNATKSSITSFEGFISDHWPGKSGVKALVVLEQQLKYGGGFCEEMKSLDLSTPPN